VGRVCRCLGSGHLRRISRSVSRTICAAPVYSRLTAHQQDFYPCPSSSAGQARRQVPRPKTAPRFRRGGCRVRLRRGALTAVVPWPACRAQFPSVLLRRTVQHGLPDVAPVSSGPHAASAPGCCGGHVDLRPLRSRGVSVFSAGLSRLSAALHPHRSFTHELALGPRLPRRYGGQSARSLRSASSALRM
jgi:hypothetical protein